MKLFIPDEFILRAENYYELSKDYTYNHGGWEDEYRKKERIIRGKTSEIFIIEFLKSNGLPIIEDNTSERENDFFDFKYNGFNYDVKCSLYKICTVTKPYEKKNIDFFIHNIVSADLKLIEIVGVAAKSVIVNSRNFYKYEEKIPGTNITNKFKEGCYMYIEPFENFLHHFKILNETMPVDYWKRLWVSLKDKT